jgi:hypothetical protein
MVEREACRGESESAEPDDERNAEDSADQQDIDPTPSHGPTLGRHQVLQWSARRDASARPA